MATRLPLGTRTGQGSACLLTGRIPAARTLVRRMYSHLVLRVVTHRPICSTSRRCTIYPVIVWKQLDSDPSCARDSGASFPSLVPCATLTLPVYLDIFSRINCGIIAKRPVPRNLIPIHRSAKFSLCCTLARSSECLIGLELYVRTSTGVREGVCSLYFLTGFGVPAVRRVRPRPDVFAEVRRV